MKLVRSRLLAGLALALVAAGAACAQGYTFQVVAQGLHRPTGIAARGGSTIYFTEIPTPGVGGGLNAVKELKLGNGAIRTIHQGEPEPVNIAVDEHGILYWTCKSAGVILERSARDGMTRVLANELDKPVGITIDARGKTLYFTEVPTPGVGGRDGGRNKVWELDLNTRLKKLVHAGDPEPTDITVSRTGTLYWTCTSAGVIVEATPVRR
jgi:hypothetical protein